MPEQEIDVVIRAVEMSDAKALVGLYSQVNEETPYVILPKFQKNGIQMQEQLIDKYITTPDALMLILEIDEQLAGVVSIAPQSNDKVKHVAEIGICLIQEYWGYGLATMMMEEAMTFIQNSDIKVLTLEVAIENDRAVQLYTRQAFEIVGTLHKRLYHHYRYYDTYMMEKIIF